MRFFRSSALAKAAKFRFEASCSAADAIDFSARSRRQARLAGGACRRSHEIGFAGLSCKRPPSAAAACLKAPIRRLPVRGSFTEPPAFSTFSIAALEAPATSNVSLAFSSPSDSSRTPSLARRMTPAAISASTSTVFLASSFLASIAVCTRAERHDVELLGEDVLEAALGQAPVERHLAALEAVDGDAGARLLALDAATGGLAGARADAAAEPLLANGSNLRCRAVR